VNPHLAKLKSRLADERGIVVPIALAMLLAALALTATAVMVASAASNTSQHDADSKAAIEAANAGLRTAVYRLDVYQPSASGCPTPTATSVGTGAPTSTLCAPQTGTLGNGASYTYWVSEEMQSTDACTGPSVSSSVASVGQRCITSLGTADGVSARVQQRVAAYTSQPVFPTAIFGTNQVTVDNNVTITTDTANSPALLGTNGTLTVAPSGGGTTVIDGYAIGSKAIISPAIGSNVTNTPGAPETQLTTQYPVPTPAWPFNSQDDTPSGSTCTSNTTNCDFEIANGITYANCLNGVSVVPNCDPSNKLGSADFSYTGTPSTENRILYLPNNSSLTLGGGIYYFCGLYMGNNSTINIVGGQATIFIDNGTRQASPGVAASTCPTTSTTVGGQSVPPGSFTMTQNSSINPGGSALKAQILVYGDQDNPGTNTVSLTNNASSSFALSAPFSTVNVSPSNNSTFRGAIAAYNVTLGNSSHFTYEADTSGYQTSSVPIYYQSYWEQCPAVSSSQTDPTAGC